MRPRSFKKIWVYVNVVWDNKQLKKIDYDSITLRILYFQEARIKRISRQFNVAMVTFPSILLAILNNQFETIRAMTALTKSEQKK